MKLSPSEKICIKKLFNTNGYVLDFSNENFDDFTEQCVGVRLKEYYKCSKGEALERYVDEADISNVIILVQELLKYANTNDDFFVLNHTNSVNLCMEMIKKYKLYSDKQRNIQNENEPIVFLSHSSKDKKYGDALRNLLIGLGLENEQLIYTSHPLHGIPVGENIFEYLRKHIHSNVFMIFLLSDEYFESVPCLNEMGAAWVSKSDYMSVFIPKFNFRNTKFIDCVIDDKNMGVKLSDPNCKIKILELKNKIKNIFNLPTDEANESYLVDEFMEKIASIEKDDIK